LSRIEAYVIPLILAGAALATTIYGQAQAKKAGKKDAEANAAALRADAVTSRATGQRVASDERRKARLLESALQARAGGDLSPGIVDMMTEVAGEGEYRALSALYEGETGALGRESQAAAGLRGAKSRAKAADWNMLGTVLGGASSMAGRYGGGGGGLTTKYALGPNAGPQLPTDY
jgi:hypothetical protein